MKRNFLFGIVTITTLWLSACTVEVDDDDGSATGSGQGASGPTSGAGAGGPVSCDDVCDKSLSCDPGATSCSSVCPQLSESCKSCILQNACVDIDAECTALCTGGSNGSSSSGGNCSQELSGCDYDSDCCSNNCYDNSCDCRLFGCGCDYDSDCDSNNCYENSCQ